MQNLTDVDWSAIPAPKDDEDTDHLLGMTMPVLTLPATDGTLVDLSSTSGLTVVYAYPRTGRPDQALPEGWDMIPGARGCTPQSCAFRDHFAELRDLGVKALYGLSTQDTSYQREAVERLHLPFPLLSDQTFELSEALALPSFETSGMRLLKRLTMILHNGKITKVFYPIFPPDRNAGDVVDWLKDNR